MCRKTVLGPVIGSPNHRLLSYTPTLTPTSAYFHFGANVHSSAHRKRCWIWSRIRDKRTRLPRSRSRAARSPCFKWRTCPLTRWASSISRSTETPTGPRPHASCALNRFLPSICCAVCSCAQVQSADLLPARRFEPASMDATCSRRTGTTATCTFGKSTPSAFLAWPLVHLLRAQIRIPEHLLLYSRIVFLTEYGGLSPVSAIMWQNFGEANCDRRRLPRAVLRAAIREPHMRVLRRSRRLLLLLAAQNKLDCCTVCYSSLTK